MQLIKQEIIEYINNRRTLSYGNLCESFSIPKDEIQIIIEELGKSRAIRVANSPCSLDCSSCSSCATEDDQKSELSPTTIIISMVIKTG